MSLVKLAGDLILQHTIDTNSETTELETEFLDLGSIEVENNKLRKILPTTRLLSEIIDANTEVFYDRAPKRSEIEFLGGYKIALARGATLNETNVVNLSFHIKGPKFTANGIAAMYRNQNKEEWILLLPDYTQDRINYEKEAYLIIAREFVLLKGIMDSEEQNTLLENLAELNINERCAQSLMHEFGHVLHWRKIDTVGFIKGNCERYEEFYQWCYECGYLNNVDKRIPNFSGLEPLQQVNFLKESLVEDYRISLNLLHKGKYILPNVVSHQGDFCKPFLLEEGISIMKKMLIGKADRQVINSKTNFEMDRIETANMLLERQQKYNWIPGKTSMTEKRIKEVFDNLKYMKINQYLNEVATTKEEDS